MICNITIEEEKRSNQNVENLDFGGDGRNRNQQCDLAGTGRQQMQRGQYSRQFGQDANSFTGQI